VYRKINKFKYGFITGRQLLMVNFGIKQLVDFT